MYDDDECPECQALMVNNFQYLDAKRYIFQCCQCKSYFIPDEEPENPHISDEEIEELYMRYDDQCPNFKLYVREEFYVKDYDKKLFACRNCKSNFIGVSSYPYNRRTKWIPTTLH